MGYKKCVQLLALMRDQGWIMEQEVKRMVDKEIEKWEERSGTEVIA